MKIEVSKGLLSKEEASVLRDGILDDFGDAGRSIISAAIKLRQFRMGKGWLALGYPTETEWREAEIPWQEFQNARAAIKMLDVGVEPEILERMKISNVHSMVKHLPEKKWLDPNIQAAAISETVANFDVQVRAKAETLGTLAEDWHARGWHGPASVVENWDLALKVAELVDGAKALDKRVDAIIATYLNSQSARPGLSRLQLYFEIAPQPKKEEDGEEEI